MTRFVHIAIGKEFYNELKEYFINDTDNMFMGEVRCFDEDTTVEKLKILESMYIKQLDVSNGAKIVIWVNNEESNDIAFKFLVNRFKINDVFKVKLCESSKGEFNKINSLNWIGKSLDEISIVTKLEKNNLINKWELLKR